MDIPSFLSLHPPFDELDEEQLAHVVRNTLIQFFPAGTVLLRQFGEPSGFLYVVRTGAVEVVDGTQVIDFLGEGEVFGHFSLLSGLGPAFSIRAAEDTICYLIDPEVANEVVGTRRGLSFLSSTLRRREIRALDGIDPRAVDPWQTPVGSLLHRAVVTAEPTVTIRDAAELMTRERVSSLLVEGAEGLGIITDRDLRSRVLAQGRDPEAAVGDVLTSPVLTVPRDTMVAAVMAFMLEHGVHHVPVVGDDGTLMGVVTDADLMGLEQKSPFVLKTGIERSKDAEEAVEVAWGLRQTLRGLVDANVDPIDVAHTVTVVIDTLTRRLLEAGIQEIGNPPCFWAWVALGSEARHEQALLTDQDTMFVIDPAADIDAVNPYFQALTAFVTDRLERAGIRKCRAGVIASNREWRDTLGGWERRFRQWIVDPGRIGSAFSGIVFDYRPVAGPLDVRSALDEVIRTAAGEREFIRHLGRLAIDGRPPTGFLKDAVVEARGTPSVTLDVKKGGIVLVTNLARVYAISSGLSENRTLRRLGEAEVVGRINEETRQGLEESFRLLWQIRLEHQARQVAAGIPPDDLVDPRSIGPLTRQGLKEAFRMIERAQAALAVELGLRR